MFRCFGLRYAAGLFFAIHSTIAFSKSIKAFCSLIEFAKAGGFGEAKISGRCSDLQCPCKADSGLRRRTGINLNGAVHSGEMLVEVGSRILFALEHERLNPEYIAQRLSFFNSRDEA